VMKFSETNEREFWEARDCFIYSKNIDSTPTGAPMSIICIAVCAVILCL